MKLINFIKWSDFSIFRRAFALFKLIYRCTSPEMYLIETSSRIEPNSCGENTYSLGYFSNEKDKSPAVARVSRQYSWCTLATCVHNCPSMMFRTCCCLRPKC